ncbi:MAG: hypothetical protein HYZ81_01745 [Nitrospinae bacterium]|nr:hypothetical protein [Nitrospinota bacterium]
MPRPGDEPLPQTSLRRTGLRPRVAARKATHVHANPSINIVGIGIGDKLIAGKMMGERRVKGLGAEKCPRHTIGLAHRIPTHSAGLPRDIAIVMVRPFCHPFFLRPASPALAVCPPSCRVCDFTFTDDALSIKQQSCWLDLKRIALSCWITFRGTWEHRGRKV